MSENLICFIYPIRIHQFGLTMGVERGDLYLALSSKIILTITKMHL